MDYINKSLILLDLYILFILLLQLLHNYSITLVYVYIVDVIYLIIDVIPAISKLYIIG